MALAYTAGGLLALLVPLAAAVLCNAATAALIVAYLVMQLAYCVSLKHVLVVDLVVVTSGFLMRAMSGGLALGIPLSRWFLITAGFGALFMVSAKRYSEALRATGEKGRPARCCASTPRAICASSGSSRPVARSSRTACGRWRAATARTCCPGASCRWCRSSSPCCATPSSPTGARPAHRRTWCCATGRWPSSRVVWIGMYAMAVADV